jgi:hypothetical protein
MRSTVKDMVLRLIADYGLGALPCDPAEEAS